MSFLRAGKGGGGVNPTLVDSGCIVRVSGTMKTFSVDTSKKYILTFTYKYNDNVFRSDICYIHDKTLEHLGSDEPPTGATISINASGNTVTITGINTASYYNDYMFVQLD